MIILAGVTIKLMSDNGVIGKSQNARNETNKQVATEKMNFKLTTIQIDTYNQKGRMPNLQEVADGLCKDEADEIQYVELESQAVSSLKLIEVPKGKSIFTKLKEYPYEFEINDKLQLASIDGIQIADSGNGGSNGNIISMTQEELESLIDSKVNEKLQNYSTTEQIADKYVEKSSIQTNIENGSYIGTGICGASNKNTLAFSRPPKIVFILSDGLDSNGHYLTAIFVQGCKHAAFSGYSGTTSNGETLNTSFSSWGNNGCTLSWYSSNAIHQFNEKNKQFNWIAIF